MRSRASTTSRQAVADLVDMTATLWPEAHEAEAFAARLESDGDVPTVMLTEVPAIAFLHVFAHDTAVKIAERIANLQS